LRPQCATLLSARRLRIDHHYVAGLTHDELPGYANIVLGSVHLDTVRIVVNSSLREYDGMGSHG